MSAIYLCRKAVDAVESRYDHKRLCKRCRRVCRHFNYYIYGGRQVILPEQLTERDSTKIALPYGADGAVVPVQKFRDVQKLYAAMTDGKMEYVLYGAENQAEIHYAMAVKNNLYDALEYAGQQM